MFCVGFGLEVVNLWTVIASEIAAICDVDDS